MYILDQVTIGKCIYWVQYMHNVRVFVFYWFHVELHRLKELRTELSTINGMCNYLFVVVFFVGEYGTIQNAS